MIIFKTVAGVQQYLEKQLNAGKSIGFVPTMGALHMGHLSLINASKQRHHVTVASIFVNPTQFNDPKDFEKYPVTIDTDCEALELHKTDVLFLPTVEEMYPLGTVTNSHYNLGELENVLEGKYRPGHFQGVCQVVERLLRIISPNEIFIGQKDFQQCMVIKRLIELMEPVRINIEIAPTLREADGLAMSSRNMRLNAKERQIATTIYQQLRNIKEQYGKAPIEVLKTQAVDALLQNGFTKVDYVEIAEASTLQLQNEYNPDKKCVALVAAFINNVRLIDNILLN